MKDLVSSNFDMKDLGPMDVILGIKLIKKDDDTSAKSRKGYSLFSAVFALPAFVKNVVAFFKLF